MDAYAFALEKLRDNDLRRLRAFASDGTGKFTTWLVVVGRRLAHDWHRQSYGRNGHVDDSACRSERDARRRLVDLASEAIDLAGVPDASHHGLDADVLAEEIRTALAAEIDALNAEDRLLIRLRFEDGLSAKDIAAVTKAPTPFHVYRRLNQVLERLKRGLVARGVESPMS
jgi:RNA polymerase sigma factor (sigma-70 family)